MMPPADQDELLAFQMYTERELNEYLNQLTDQKANDPPSVTLITLARLGLI